jgi:hypothetical protein
MEPALQVMERLKAAVVAGSVPDDFAQPKNSLSIANPIIFLWLAFFWGGHSFLSTEPKHFADTVNAFIQ